MCLRGFHNGSYKGLCNLWGSNTGDRGLTAVSRTSFLQVSGASGPFWRLPGVSLWAFGVLSFAIWGFRVADCQAGDVVLAGSDLGF